jgi:hypothetical protein
VKFFGAVDLMALLADREWSNEATKTIGQFWKQKTDDAKPRISNNQSNPNNFVFNDLQTSRIT